jgi:hypothetical protein
LPGSFEIPQAGAVVDEPGRFARAGYRITDLVTLEGDTETCP